MAPKGLNTKKEIGKARKAENTLKQKGESAAEKERQEAARWEEGAKTGKGSKQEKEEKRKADLARKAEKARLLAEEEASIASETKARKKAAAKAVKPAGPGAIAAGDEEPEPLNEESPVTVESFAATGIDDALELLEFVTGKVDKASVGQLAAGLERHPERRLQAAYEAYRERELPKLKEEHPGLRLQQYKDILYKRFRKSPDNPFNQTVVAFDATKEQRFEALKAKQAEIEERFRES